MGKITDPQPLLPGIDEALKKEQRSKYDKLIADNPFPKTLEEAEDFLRHKCTTSMFLEEDHDFVRVVLKNTDVSERERKFQYSDELPLNDKELWVQKYIELAQEVYLAWADLEAPKQ